MGIFLGHRIEPMESEVDNNQFAPDTNTDSSINGG